MKSLSSLSLPFSRWSKRKGSTTPCIQNTATSLPLLCHNHVPRFFKWTPTFSLLLSLSPTSPWESQQSLYHNSDHTISPLRGLWWSYPIQDQNHGQTRSGMALPGVTPYFLSGLTSCCLGPLHTCSLPYHAPALASGHVYLLECPSSEFHSLTSLKVCFLGENLLSPLEIKIIHIPDILSLSSILLSPSVLIPVDIVCVCLLRLLLN